MGQFDQVPYVAEAWERGTVDVDRRNRWNPSEARELRCFGVSHGGAGGDWNAVGTDVLLEVLVVNEAAVQRVPAKVLVCRWCAEQEEVEVWIGKFAVRIHSDRGLWTQRRERWTRKVEEFSVQEPGVGKPKGAWNPASGEYETPEA